MKKTKGDSLPKDPQQSGELSAASLPALHNTTLVLPPGKPATRKQEKLYNAGWRITVMRRRGMIKVVRWEDPITGSEYHQGYAYRVMRWREAKARKDASLRCAFECAEELSHLEWEPGKTKPGPARAIWQRYEAKHNAGKDATNSPHEGNG